MFDLRTIKNDADYEAALARIDKLMEAEAGTREGEELELLAMLVEAFEEKHHAIDLQHNC
jgi:HTH-type transcriptional regulator / antitoxin HigA